MSPTIPQQWFTDLFGDISQGKIIQRRFCYDAGKTD